MSMTSTITIFILELSLMCFQIFVAILLLWIFFDAFLTFVFGKITNLSNNKVPNTTLRLCGFHFMAITLLLKMQTNISN
jgi:hypothetical protein